MALRNYVVIKGTASALALDDDDSPHIEIRLEAESVSYRLAVNTRSVMAPHDLLYRKQDPFVHPMTGQLKGLPSGVTDLRQNRADLALDYVRGGFVQREAMEIAPFKRIGPDNDLRDFIEPIVNEGINDPSIHFYAFGERWGPEDRNPDKYFGFLPGNGVHDIHMNQGSRGRFQGSNGPNQDGALLIHRSNTDHWAAIFLAFQSQSWNTDANGHPVSEDEPDHPDVDPLAPPLSIIAAMINPEGTEEGQEGVTLINRTDRDVDLSGWGIADRINRRHDLTGQIAAGDARRVIFPRDPDAPRLGNKRGKIVLLSPDGVAVHAIEYDKLTVSREGWTTVF